MKMPLIRIGSFTRDPFRTSLIIVRFAPEATFEVQACVSAGRGKLTSFALDKDY